ncbi:MAG: hypothetical protein V4754_07415 [Pseudomonadota bacterium]
MNLEKVMMIYREAVDPTATAAEGVDWCRAVQAEIMAVIAVPTKAAAAAVIV